MSWCVCEDLSILHGDNLVRWIDLGQIQTTLDEVIGWARDRPVALRLPDGAVFALSRVDDLDFEIAALRKQPDFLGLLRRIGEEPATISLEELRAELSS
ncbi:MAG: hypothetical protein U0835_19700 [Isosphaeraceae bacterium]